MAADPRPPRALRGRSARAAVGPALGPPEQRSGSGAAPGAARRPRRLGGTGIWAWGFGSRSCRCLLWEPGRAASSSAGGCGWQGRRCEAGSGLRSVAASRWVGRAALGRALPLRLRPARGSGPAGDRVPFSLWPRGAGAVPVPGPHRHHRSRSAASGPAGGHGAAPQPPQDAEPPRPGSPVATALPCEQQRLPPPPRVRIPRDPRRTGGVAALGLLLPLRLCPVRGWRSPEPPQGRDHLLSLALQGRSCRALPVARSVPNARPGTGTGAPDSAGTDTAKGLPVAPQPGTALNRHAGMLQPGQTPPTAQKDPKERLALPGNGGTAVCRGALTAIPVSDLPELPHSCQILNPKQ
ncbi:uncharacterized protein [Taeniopygia guttata]|uniref:uncharacterized protein n=1 Tax=Taeniopygia guttata TaxID=59729 RepID=UPI0011AF3134|nr:uncharacterized protein KIAA1522-like [Taeniopygia guttata]